MKSNIRISIISSISSIILFLISLVLGLRSGVITEVTYVRETAILFAVAISLLSAVQILSVYRFRVISFYIGVILSLTFSITLLMTVQTVLFAPVFVVVALEIISLVAISKDIEMPGLRLLVQLISLAIMIYLGNLLQPAFNRPGTGMILESTQSVFVALGQNIPFLERQGLFIITTYFDLIVSLQQYILFAIISVLISENYFHIIRFVGKRKTRGEKTSVMVYGLTAALSCQCESYIAFLPAFSLLLINYVLFPSILLSIFLLSATYLLVSRRYSEGRQAGFLNSLYTPGGTLALNILGAVILLFTPIFVSFVVYFGLLTNALYFFSTGMIMVLDGYVMMLIFSRIFSFRRSNSRFGTLLAIAGSALIFVWFYPTITREAFLYPGAFVAMNVCMFAGGLAYGYAYLTASAEWRDILNEYLSTLFGAFSLIIFYIIATFEISIWPFFSIQSQVSFSLVTWVIMLPMMWLTTHISLNRMASDEMIAQKIPSIGAVYQSIRK